VTARAARPRARWKETPSYPHRWLRHPHFDVGPPGLKRPIATCIQTKSRANLAPHGRDARATMWVS